MSILQRCNVRSLRFAILGLCMLSMFHSYPVFTSPFVYSDVSSSGVSSSDSSEANVSSESAVDSAFSSLFYPLPIRTVAGDNSTSSLYYLCPSSCRSGSSEQDLTKTLNTHKGPIYHVRIHDGTNSNLPITIFPSMHGMKTTEIRWLITHYHIWLHLFHAGRTGQLMYCTGDGGRICSIDKTETKLVKLAMGIETVQMQSVLPVVTLPACYGNYVQSPNHRLAVGQQ